jgi:hypothetical protein
VVISNTLPLLPPVETVEAKDAEEGTEEEMKPAAVDSEPMVDQGPPMLQKTVESEEEAEEKEAWRKDYIVLNAAGFAMGHREEATDEDSEEDADSPEMNHAHKIMRLLKQCGHDAERRRAGYNFTDYDMSIADWIAERGTITNYQLRMLKKKCDTNGRLKPAEPMLEPKEGGK